MRDETRKKLEKIASTERWVMIAVAALAVVLGGGIMIGQITSKGRDFNGTMKGTLLHFDHESTEGLIVDMRVQLDDGRLVQLRSETGFAPPPGTKIMVSQRVSWFGWPTLYWDGRVQ